MITFEKGNNKFNFRVAGMMLHKNRILLHTTLKDDFWNLPGGRVEFREDTSRTLIREIREELDIEVQVDKLGFIREDFFEYDGKNYHEIGFYYFVSIPDDHEIATRQGEFYGVEDHGRLIFKWFPLDALDTINVYPENLRTELLEVRDGTSIKHYINHSS